MENHQKYMDLAIELAKKGRGQVNPNPLVGAVIVKDDVIIGSGYHEKYGGLHAERQALAACTQSAAGATLYVTLEPCCHHGKTPPCTAAIIESQISRVVIGSVDPNPLVSGKGIEILRQQGITVITGVREAACQELNTVFFHYIKTKTPYVLMKYAMTLDGKIATYTGKSKWITGAAARAAVHQTRHEMAGIMVGVNTILQDDPQLTCRIEGGRNPSRIICDTHLRTPLSAQVVATARKIPTYLATCCRDQSRIKRFEIMGCKVLAVPPAGEHLDLQVLMVQLGANMYYNTSYYAPYYEPATQQFQVQDEVKVGNFPLVNAYVNFHLKQARFFVMGYNLGSKFVNPNYFSLAHYPLDPFVLKMGVAVTFNN